MPPTLEVQTRCGGGGGSGGVGGGGGSGVGNGGGAVSMESFLKSISDLESAVETLKQENVFYVLWP